MTQLPTYLKEVFKVDIKADGLMSSLPFLSSWASIVISSILADKLIASQAFSKLKIRKVFNGLG